MAAGVDTTSFVAALDETVRPRFEATPNLGNVLAAALAAARSERPDVEIEDVLVLAHFARKLPADARPEDPFAGLAVGDLRLACACLAGVPSALAALDRELALVARQVAHRLRVQDGEIDELAQLVRAIVLVPRASGELALAGYAGRAELGTWLRIIATREGLRLAKSARREPPADDDVLLAVVAPSDDPATQHVKDRYRGELKLVLEEAIATLSAKDKNLLRYQAIDGLSVEDIGRIYQVHRTTAARWVDKARSTLVARTRRIAQRRLQIAPDELESIFRLIQSRFEATFSRLLR
jgi:RNA polymerase sigma-70 factor (ECF subfamily)